MFARNTTLFSLLFIVLVMGLVACSSAASVTPVVQADTSDSSTAVINEEVEDAYLPTVMGEGGTATGDLTYPIVDINQGLCYDESDVITCPSEGEAFYGQDAQGLGVTEEALIAALVIAGGNMPPAGGPLPMNTP